MDAFTGTQTGNVYRAAAGVLGSGGEAVVRAVDGMPGLVLKLYKKPTALRRCKVEALVQRLPGPRAQERFTWPLEPVTDARGWFAGFVMRRLPARSEPLFKVYETREAAKLGFSHADQVRIALNLARAYEDARALGVVVGDANDENAVVDLATGDVVLLDCDGFVFDTWPGTGWSPDASAPETHKAVQAGTGFYYDEYTDRFTLADHVFRLLMNGFGPFACRTTNGSLNRPTVAQAIERGLFIYDPPASAFPRRHRLGVPVGAPSYARLPAEVRALFKRAFTDAPARRPSPAEWCRALERLCAAGASSSASSAAPAPHARRGAPRRARTARRHARTRAKSAARCTAPSPGVVGWSGIILAALLVASQIAASGQCASHEGQTPAWVDAPAVTESLRAISGLQNNL